VWKPCEQIYFKLNPEFVILATNGESEEGGARTMKLLTFNLMKLSYGTTLSLISTNSNLKMLFPGTFSEGEMKLPVRFINKIILPYQQDF
jgi:hypothetical protein